jgi:hypothetical protein
LVLLVPFASGNNTIVATVAEHLLPLIGNMGAFRRKISHLSKKCASGNCIAEKNTEGLDGSHRARHGPSGEPSPAAATRHRVGASRLDQPILDSKAGDLGVVAQIEFLEQAEAVGIYGLDADVVGRGDLAAGVA